MKNLILPIVLGLLLASCDRNQTTQIGENTFVRGDKVYRVIDNEINEIGELSSKAVRKVEVLKPTEKNYGNHTLSYVKEGASTQLDALYRGNFLYYRLTLINFTDLKSGYNPGVFTIEFMDDFGFIIHTAQVPTNELIGMVGANNEVQSYVFNGKTEMSSDINKAIKEYSVSSTVKAKSKSSYNPWY